METMGTIVGMRNARSSSEDTHSESWVYCFLRGQGVFEISQSYFPKMSWVILEGLGLFRLDPGLDFETRTCRVLSSWTGIAKYRGGGSTAASLARLPLGGTPSFASGSETMISITSPRSKRAMVDDHALSDMRTVWRCPDIVAVMVKVMLEAGVLSRTGNSF